jgi:molecular chaperone GrpE (heat shock protein)
VEVQGVRALEAVRQMLVDLMFKYDVEPFRSESEQFDPKSQQCVQTVATTEPAADKTIASRRAEGFRSPEGIVRREQVSVYKFTPGAD